MWPLCHGYYSAIGNMTNPDTLHSVKATGCCGWLHLCDLPRKANTQETGTKFLLLGHGEGGSRTGMVGIQQCCFGERQCAGTGKQRQSPTMSTWKAPGQCSFRGWLSCLGGHISVLLWGRGRGSRYKPFCCVLETEIKMVNAYRFVSGWDYMLFPLFYLHAVLRFFFFYNECLLLSS